MNYYTYVHNNPLRFQDPSGNIPVETIADVISIGLSGYNLLQNPSWLNAGYLAWDVGAALIPYVPGSYVGKGTGALIKGADSQLLKLDLQFFSKGTGKVLTRDKLLNAAENQKLKNAINEIYRPGAKVGDGGTADIIRQELRNGETTHIKKGFERITNLENIIKKQNLSSSDLKIANKLLADLKDALKGVNKP